MLPPASARSNASLPPASARSNASLPPASARSHASLPLASARSNASSSSIRSIRGRGFDLLHPTWSQAVVAAAADVAAEAKASQTDSRSSDFSDNNDHNDHKFEPRVEKQWSRLSDPFDAPPPPADILAVTPMYEENLEEDIPTETPLTDLALHQIEYGLEADSPVHNGYHLQDPRDEEAIPAEAPVIHPGTEREQLPLFLAMQPLPVQPWLEPTNGFHDPWSQYGSCHEPSSRSEGTNDVAKVWQHLPPLPMIQEDAFIRENQTPIARENVVFLQDWKDQQDEQSRNTRADSIDKVYPTRIGQQGSQQQHGIWETAVAEGPKLVPPDSPCASPRLHVKTEPKSPSGSSSHSPGPQHMQKREPLSEPSPTCFLHGTPLVEPKQVELSLEKHFCHERFGHENVESAREAAREARKNKLASMSGATAHPSPSRTNLQQLRATLQQEARELLCIDMWPRCSSLCCSMWVPMCALVLTLIFLCGLAALLWYGETPGISEGAFGLITQIDTQSSLRYNFIAKAKKDAMSTLSAEDPTKSDENGGEYLWRRVEVVFQMRGADLLHVDSLKIIRKAEDELRGLPGWQQLCNEKVPEGQRHFCDPGDSFVAVAYGSESKASDEAASFGVLKEVAFDGGGSRLLMPLEPFLRFLKNFQGNAYKRWLAQTDEDGNQLRTMFSFYLPEKDEGMWDKFVQEELEPKLVEQAERGDGPCGDGPDIEDAPKLRVFYRATGLHSKDLTRAVSGDIQMSVLVASCGTFLPTFLATRRILLGITALLLAVAAPTIASALAATKGTQDMLEYPAIAIAPWFLIAVSCTDLAVACTSAWELKSWSSHKTCQLSPCCCECSCLVPLRRLFRFMAEVPMPACAPVLMFLCTGAIVNVPLISEFALHMGLGLLTAVLFSSLVHPPAIELGNFLHRQLKHIRPLKSLRRRCRTLMPWELGGKPHNSEVVLGISRTFAKILGSKTVLCLVLITTVVILWICANSSSPSYHLILPDLFDEDHRLSKGPKIWALFGEEQSKFDAPAEILQNARKCTPDAFESAGCSWHKCEVNPYERLQDNNCVCYQNTPGGGCRSSFPAAARFVGLDRGSDFYGSGRFWQYAEEALRRPLINGSVSAWEMGAVEMENWQTGQVIAVPQVSARVNRADGSVTSWEDACFRALCYCNLRPCALSRAWKFLGRFPISSAGNPGRRMFAQATSSSTVFVVWGMAPPEKVPSQFEAQNYVFDYKFNVRNPWTQRNILGLCEATPPALQVFSRQCWAMDFKSWLYERGERYPVHSRRFDALFMEFVASARAKSAELTAGVLPPGAERARSYRYFWFAPNGSMSGCFATFDVHTPPRQDDRKVLNYIVHWHSYISKRNRKFNCAPGAESWFACPFFASVEELLVVKNAARTTLFWAFASAALLVFVLTFSCGLTLAILAGLGLSVGCFAALSVYLGERSIGIVEILGLATFMMILIVPMARISFQYILVSSGIYDDTLNNEPSLEDADLLTLVSRLPRANTTTSTLGKGLALATTEMYLVDNRGLKATSLGLGYRLSPRIADLDREADIADSLAPWGSKVVGTPFGDDWIKVNHRFLPVRLHGICVLTLVDPSEEEDTLSGSQAQGRTSVFSRATIADAVDDIMKYVTGLSPDVQLWAGAPRAERMDRLSRALGVTFPSAFASSLASAVVGGGLLILRIKAFEVVGFAALCGAFAAPVAALGLMSVLTIWGFGPTQAYRKASLDFVKWMADDRHKSKGRSDSPPQSDIKPMISSLSMSVRQPASDSQAAGETAARVLGFPFSLAVKSWSEHIHDLLHCRSRGQKERARIQKEVQGVQTTTIADGEEALAVWDDSAHAADLYSVHAADVHPEAEVHTGALVGEEHLVDDPSRSKRDTEKRELDDEVRDILAAARTSASSVPQQTFLAVEDFEEPDLWQSSPYQEPDLGSEPSGTLSGDMLWYARNVPERVICQQDDEVRELLAAARGPAVSLHGRYRGVG